MQDTKINPNGEIIIYKDSDGPEIKVILENESVWLSQAEMADLFQKDVKTISKHISHIYEEKELERIATSHKKANSTNMSIGLNKPTTFYNLDIIISVGYRVHSKRGTLFRIWATQRLRDYILKGFIVNEQRLKDKSQAKLRELEGAVKLLQGAIESNRLIGYEKDLLRIITDYTDTWVLLNKYDRDDLEVTDVTKKVVYTLEYAKVIKSVWHFKNRLLSRGEATELFGKESGAKLHGLLGSIEQTFDGKQLYASAEEKAAHLLYFSIKDHPFVDGNKRIGSLLFLLYLIENRIFYNKKGERKFSDSALTTLALLVAESSPEHKEIMIKLVVNLVGKK